MVIDESFQCEIRRIVITHENVERVPKRAIAIVDGFHVSVEASLRRFVHVEWQTQIENYILQLQGRKDLL